MTGGATDRGVSGPVLAALLNSRSVLRRASLAMRGFLPVAACLDLTAAACLDLTAALLGSCRLLVAFFASLADCLPRAPVDFLGEAGKGALRTAVTFERTPSLAEIDAPFLVDDFLGLVPVAFWDKRGSAFCFLDAERFDNLLDDLRRTAVTRLLIESSFQRERHRAAVFAHAADCDHVGGVNCPPLASIDGG